MTDYRLVPVEQIRRALHALEKFANDTLTGRNAADELRELLSAAQQPAAVDGATVERIAALLYEETTGEPWTVADVEHYRFDRDYYRRLAHKVIALTAQQPAAVDGAVDKARFRRAPCHLCGYNGPGYYQPDTHPCAAKY